MFRHHFKQTNGQHRVSIGVFHCYLFPRIFVKTSEATDEQMPWIIWEKVRDELKVSTHMLPSVSLQRDSFSSLYKYQFVFLFSLSISPPDLYSERLPDTSSWMIHSSPTSPTENPTSPSPKLLLLPPIFPAPWFCALQNQGIVLTLLGTLPIATW